MRFAVVEECAVGGSCYRLFLRGKNQERRIYSEIFEIER